VKLKKTTSSRWCSLAAFKKRRHPGSALKPGSVEYCGVVKQIPDQEISGMTGLVALENDGCVASKTYVIPVVLLSWDLLNIVV
jgi:hypothetical protein